MKCTCSIQKLNRKCSVYSKRLFLITALPVFG